jgi:hypothetical protein
MKSEIETLALLTKFSDLIPGHTYILTFDAAKVSAAEMSQLLVALGMKHIDVFAMRAEEGGVPTIWAVSAFLRWWFCGLFL